MEKFYTLCMLSSPQRIKIKTTFYPKSLLLSTVQRKKKQAYHKAWLKNLNGDNYFIKRGVDLENYHSSFLLNSPATSNDTSSISAFHSLTKL